MQQWAEHFYNSKAWKRCRAGFIAQRLNIDGGRCEVCNRAQGYIVHHRIHLTPTNINDPSIALDWSNLQYVCKDCHDLFDGHGFTHNKTKGVVLFDDSGCPVGRTSPPV